MEDAGHLKFPFLWALIDEPLIQFPKPLLDKFGTAAILDLERRRHDGYRFHKKCHATTAMDGNRISPMSRIG